MKADVRQGSEKKRSKKLSESGQYREERWLLHCQVVSSLSPWFRNSGLLHITSMRRFLLSQHQQHQSKPQSRSFPVLRPQLNSLPLRIPAISHSPITHSLNSQRCLSLFRFRKFLYPKQSRNPIGLSVVTLPTGQLRSMQGSGCGCNQDVRLHAHAPLSQHHRCCDTVRLLLFIHQGKE